MPMEKIKRIDVVTRVMMRYADTRRSRRFRSRYILDLAITYTGWIRSVSFFPRIQVNVLFVAGGLLEDTNQYNGNGEM